MVAGRTDARGAVRTQMHSRRNWLEWVQPTKVRRASNRFDDYLLTRRASPPPRSCSADCQSRKATRRDMLWRATALVSSSARLAMLVSLAMPHACCSLLSDASRWLGYVMQRLLRRVGALPHAAAPRRAPLSRAAGKRLPSRSCSRSVARLRYLLMPTYSNTSTR